MRKYLFIILLFLLFCHPECYSQDTITKPAQVAGRTKVLEFSAGYSMALGSYRSLDRNDKKSGYATDGWQVQIAINWLSKKDLGFSLQYTLQKNPLADSTRNVVPAGWSSGTLGPGSWFNHYLLVGPVFMKSFGKIHFDARILGGLLVSSSSNFTTPNPGDTTGTTNDINLGAGFGYGISASAGYAFGKHVSLKMTLGLMGGWPGRDKQYGSQVVGSETYKDPVTGLLVTKPIYSAPIEYDIKKVVTTLNLSMGLVYRF